MARALSSTVPARFWHSIEGGLVQCDLCPRVCRLHDGQAGFCDVRACRDGGMVLTAYGRTSGFWRDPVERRDLYHFLPGTAVLTFGTRGCNLGCRFCANPELARGAREGARDQTASPEFIALAARELGCRSVAFDGNDPVVFHEFALDVALAAREQGLAAVAATAGYVSAAPRHELFGHLDAVCVELKAFDDAFYEQACGARLQPVLETLAYLQQDTAAWVEVLYRLVPGANDTARELDELTGWIAPAARASLERSREAAVANGLRYVYSPGEAESTVCPACGLAVIERSGGSVTEWNLDEQADCLACRVHCPGVLQPPQGAAPAHVAVRLHQPPAPTRAH